MKKPSKSFEIALSAIACAVATGALTLGCYVHFMYAAGILLAVFALMVPLSKGFIWGDALAFLGSALLTFLFYGFSIVMLVPYLVFFGLHPMANYLQKKYVKHVWLHVILYVAKALWFILAMWLFWQLLAVEIFGVNNAVWYDWVMRYFYYVLFFGGAAVFAAYDFMLFLCQKSVDLIIKRIRR